MSALTCPECGARLGAGKERCDLCGTRVVESAVQTPDARDDVPGPGSETSDIDDTPALGSGKTKRGDHPGSESQGAEPDDLSGSEMPAPDDPPELNAESDGVFCNQCGWKNPHGSRFCSRCGTRLQELKGAAVGAAPVPPGDPSRSVRKVTEAATQPPEPVEADDDGADDGGTSLSAYVGIIVGLAVLVIVALYMITVVSTQGVTTGGSDGLVQIPPEERSLTLIEDFAAFPLADRSQLHVDSLEQVIGVSEGAESYDVRRELVQYYVDVGRLDRASLEQRGIALSTEEPEDWRRAADLLFEWMERTEGERKEDVALVTIGALRRVLEYDEDDHDTRARLGWAYQFDARNPMEAIRQTDLVLEEDPNHLMANYNRAVFLTRINRLNQALEQFNRVRDLAAGDSLYLRRADAWMESIRRSMGGESSP